MVHTYDLVILPYNSYTTSLIYLILGLMICTTCNTLNHLIQIFVQCGLIGLSDEDMDIDTMITTYNTAVTDAASEILWKERRRKKPWVTKDVLDLCDERRDLKKKRYEAEGAKEYREANRRIQKAMKKAKEDWICAQCEEIETRLNKNKAREHISW